MNPAELDRLLEALPSRAVAVVGDFCLDRYWRLDPGIRDRSVETGLPVQQVVAERASPGGGGVVLANLRALGAGRVSAVGFIGDDGEGFELRRELSAAGVRLDWLGSSPGRRTPTFVKPVVADEPGGREHELSRYDLFPRQPLSSDEEQALIRSAEEVLAAADALVVSDYGEVGKAGTVAPAVRAALCKLARRNPGKPVLVDSRLHVGEFAGCIVKANSREALSALGRPAGDDSPSLEAAAAAASELAKHNGRPAFVTVGERGLFVAEPGDKARHVPAFPLSGELDPVGAGDSAAAAVAAALSCGASPADAGLLAVLVSSIICQQIGTTGTATAEQVRARFAEHRRRFPENA